VPRDRELCSPSPSLRVTHSPEVSTSPQPCQAHGTSPRRSRPLGHWDGARWPSAAVVTPRPRGSRRASGASAPCIIKQRHCSPSLFILAWLRGERAAGAAVGLLQSQPEDLGSLRVWPITQTGFRPLGLLTRPLPTSPPHAGWVPPPCQEATVHSAWVLSPPPLPLPTQQVLIAFTSQSPYIKAHSS